MWKSWGFRRVFNSNFFSISSKILQSSLFCSKFNSLSNDTKFGTKSFVFHRVIMARLNCTLFSDSSVFHSQKINFWPNSRKKLFSCLFCTLQSRNILKQQTHTYFLNAFISFEIDNNLSTVCFHLYSSATTRLIFSSFNKYLFIFYNWH